MLHTSEGKIILALLLVITPSSDFRGRNRYINIQTKKPVSINLHEYDTILNCSPDGKKLLYISYVNQQVAINFKIALMELPGFLGWRDGAEDIYTYDINTGKKSFVATVRTRTKYEPLSPDGSKLLH
ncbi:MAG: hypothetical protein V3T30_09370 [Thermodesulfobacteriota bacterium]